MDQRGPLNASIVEAFDLLPPQLQTAARYMLDRPDDVALLSMRDPYRVIAAQVPVALAMLSYQVLVMWLIASLGR